MIKKTTLNTALKNVFMTKIQKTYYKLTVLRIVNPRITLQFKSKMTSNFKKYTIKTIYLNLYTIETHFNQEIIV